jgi:DNA modification methylase
MLLRGDARALPMPDASVDLIVTSPPYFGLRSYQDGGGHYAGQVGAEDSPRQFVDALIECTREMVRVLKPSGSIFVNLGDKYANPAVPGNRDTLPQGGRPGQRPSSGHRSAKQVRRAVVPMGDIRPKSLMLLPERYRVAAVDELDLIARAVIVWSKPNGLPESVRDRVRRAHEDWVHLTKEPHYFAAVDEIREPPSDYARPNGTGREPRGGQKARKMLDSVNPRGRVPGSVWEIPTQPLSVPAELGVDHFAAFPMEWPRRLIQGWCPREVCSACGEGRSPVVEQVNEAYTAERKRMIEAQAQTKREASLRRQGALSAGAKTNGAGFSDISNGVVVPDRRITGYACACPDVSAPSTHGVVLDPFGGTGTTALVATMLGRTGISVDLSADYCRLAQWRASDPKQRAKAAGNDASKAVLLDVAQADLFGQAS